jgi:phosphoglucosamine mutase
VSKLFGTDGIRGLANQDPVTSELAFRLGRAIVQYCGSTGVPTKIVLGRDTRTSGGTLENSIVSGILSAGGSPCRTGVMPTPGVAYLTRVLDGGVGIVVSASHNPYEYNGFKVFSHSGSKLSEKEEGLLEEMILSQVNPSSDSPRTTTGVDLPDAGDRYGSFLQKCFPTPHDLGDMTIVLDCANGATAPIAPKVFESLGAHVIALFVRPDGKNINRHCGSQHTETLQKRVLKSGAHVGLAFDGDGDRLIAVDEKGQPLSGDQALAICARMLKEKGELDNNTVVSTIMSNIGLRLALETLGIRHVAAQVGDRHVFQEMRACGAQLGGEESGHIIFLKHQTTGDGILSGLKLLEAIQYFKQPLSRLSRFMTVFPQVLVNVAVRTRPDVDEVPQLKKAIQEAEASLGDRGRVLVRYSGTEPVCRIMAEGPDAAEVQAHANRIAECVKQLLGE